MGDNEQTSTADGAADAPSGEQPASPTADEQVREAAAVQAAATTEPAANTAPDAAAPAAPTARGVTPDATYSQGAPAGVNVDRAVPDGAPMTTTYEEALEAGYFGYTPGHANTDKLSVSAVTARDAKLGLAGTRGLVNAVVNGPEAAPTTAKPRERRQRNR